MGKNFSHAYMGKWQREKDGFPTDGGWFILASDSRNQKEVSKLNEVLNEVGIELELGDVKGEFQGLSIKINYDTFAKQKHRGAGRRKKSRGIFLTVGELKEMKKTMKNDEIIEKLGIPRSTYYRAWKEVKENDLPEDSYFPV